MTTGGRQQAAGEVEMGIGYEGKAEGQRRTAKGMGIRAAGYGNYSNTAGWGADTGTAGLR